MNFLKYLQEEFIGAAPTFGEDTVDVYVNPTSNDFREISKSKVSELRFIADPESKQLFVFDSYQCTHSVVIRYLLKKKIIHDRQIYCGYCDIRRFELKGKSHIYAESGDIRDLFNNDKYMKWFETWIPGPYKIIGDNLYFWSMK
jgi:hypothetical protein